ncbi:MAG: L-serine ammonia-lyase, iron-sulfur-dependent, subunit alpha [Christensenellaceae bacterium]
MTTARTAFLIPILMDLFAYNGGRETASMRVYSVGGGAIRIEGRPSGEGKEVYPLESFAEIRRFCEERALRLSDYAFVCEGEALKEYLKEVWQAMKASVEAGLKAQGVLPGGLGVERKARFLYRQKHIDESAETKENRLVCAYAFAVSEQNASAGTIVTAPTCGASGVLPAVLKYAQERRGYSDDSIVRALAAGGIVGNLIKTNASISGAECGCQAEIGSACCMAAAALGELYEMELGQIEYAAETMEHQLGLTCDPIGGLVQIPCIERNAVAAMRAINAVSLAIFSDSRRFFRFGRGRCTKRGKIFRRYRETAEEVWLIIRRKEESLEKCSENFLKICMKKENATNMRK